MTKLVKDTIHAKGIDIGIYTTDFENEYVSLTDIAKYRSIEPRVTIHNWLRGRDIVISDIKMQGMDGLELAQRLKEKNPAVIVILLSAYKDFSYAQKGFEYGVSNYLLKHELCEEKLLYELEKVKKRLSENEQKKKNRAVPH